MEKEIFCEQCSKQVPTEEIYQHVENFHVGVRAQGDLVDLLCGDCEFRAAESTGNSLVLHCVQAQHFSSFIRADWSDFMEKEAKRQVDVVAAAIEWLRSNTDVISDPSKTSDHESCVFESNVSGPEDSADLNSALDDNLNSSIEFVSQHLGTLQPTEKHKGMKRDELRASIFVKSSKSAKRRKTHPSSTGPKKRIKQSKADISNENKEQKNSPSLKEANPASCSEISNDIHPELPETSQTKINEEMTGSSDPELNNEETLPGKDKIELAENSEEQDVIGIGHKKRLSGETSAECLVCSRVLEVFPPHSAHVLKRRLIIHAIAHAKVRMYQCSVCLSPMSSRPNVKSHIKDRHCGGAPESIECAEDIAKVICFLVQCYPAFDWLRELSGISSPDFRRYIRDGSISDYFDQYLSPDISASMKIGMGENMKTEIPGTNQDDGQTSSHPVLDQNDEKLCV